MTKQRTWYMHTIDGKPALFADDTLCFAVGRHVVTLVPSLAQIRREQRADRAWYDTNMPQMQVRGRLGYVLVRLPESSP
jgi:hypothetical protein